MLNWGGHGMTSKASRVQCMLTIRFESADDPVNCLHASISWNVILARQMVFMKMTMMLAIVYIHCNAYLQ